MFIITLKFADKSKAALLMDAHNAWIKRSLDEGIFLLVGSLQPNGGGGILAHNISRADLEIRIQADPFVAEGVVTPDILEIKPGLTNERLSFLKD